MKCELTYKDTEKTEKKIRGRRNDVEQTLGTSVCTSTQTIKGDDVVKNLV